MAAAERLVTGVVALVAFGALTAQAAALSGGEDTDALWPLLWRMSGSFSVLANVAVAAILGLVGFAGLVVSSRRAGAITVAILAVAIVNHAFPGSSGSSGQASSGAMTGSALWAEAGMHTVVPPLVLLWWLVFARRDSLRGFDALLWLGWPLAYVAYVLVRQTLTGTSPYAFLDVSVYGWPGIGVHVAGFGLLILLLGAGLLLISKALGPQKRRRLSR